MNIRTVRDKARLIARLAAESKGEDIVLIDISKVSTMCDWFVLASASSARRIKTISDFVSRELSKMQAYPVRVEGRANPFWSLVDMGDVVLHVFYKDIRDFYGLERLWSDSPREYFDGKCFTQTSRKNSNQ